MTTITGLDEDGARRRIEQLAKQSGGVRSLAKLLKASPSCVSDVLNGRRAPGPALLDAVGLKRVVVYVSRRPREIE